MKKVVMMLALALLGSNDVVLAQQPVIIISDETGWHKIGQTKVDYQKETDEMILIGANRFSKLIFRVDDAPINLVSLKISYESGDVQDVVIDMPIKSDEYSKMIDLNGGERSIKRISFIYKTLSNTKDVKATVEIWGLKINTDAK